MAKMSFVDNAYYENPGVMLGGWIAFCLNRFSQNNSLELRAGFPSAICHPGRHFPSLTDLLQELDKEHKPSYRYRGQTRRRYARTEGQVHRLREAFPHLDPLRIAFENLVPSSVRSVFKECPDNPADWDSWVPIPLFDQLAPAVRAVCNGPHEPARVFFLRGFARNSNGRNQETNAGAWKSPPPA